VKFRNEGQYIKTHPHHLHPNQTQVMQTQIRKKKKMILYNYSFYNAHILFCNACSKMTHTKIKVMNSFLIRVARVTKGKHNYFNYNFTGLYIRYYDKFSRIQRIQSINKQTEYDNLVLEQDILSKKK
jgi:hypothetical protein